MHPKITKGRDKVHVHKRIKIILVTSEINTVLLVLRKLTLIEK